jgi:ATP-dependent helicase Lhr and Lhr-like helicase
MKGIVSRSTPMGTSSFHPVIQRWFAETLGEPTTAQRRGWAAIGQGRNTLIAAPTGSGKTLAAFLTAIDDLFKEGLQGPLPDEVRVLYVSPLKALSTDIHKNLAEPRHGIREIAKDAGLDAPRITAAVRTGDTTQSDRAAMLKTPPHILVTTPESLYLLLTAERSRAMLRTVRTVIVDEIHAVIGTRRGAHLALSLERLRNLVGRPLLRLGLSATQKPIEDVARWLSGTNGGPCEIVDEGHAREMDLAIEVPRSELDAVMSHEVWEEYYDRIATLVQAHRTTLVFVNTRNMAERLARHLTDRLGDDAVTAHHGSLSKEKRLDAETRLKSGQLRALVATASLELGIDIGYVDLVCQIGSPHRIATLLQRVGRSGHTVKGTPKGRLFPVSRDDLMECAALFRSVRRRELDAIVQHDAPLDVLAQQVVAESAASDAGSNAESELFEMVREAWPYRALERTQFDAVVKMAAEGFSTRRGRRAALLHRDEVHGTVRGRRGARLLAQTSGGAIPEIADYRVLLDPGETFIGTLNEDFAIESNAGDIFQLGNASWQILQVTSGTVRVADAKGAPPTIPFWLGEAPARSDELSRAVSDLRDEADRRISDGESSPDWLIAETGLTSDAADQLVSYFAEGRRVLGAIPTQQALVLERFFDESGGMQLVLHAPFGSRINKAWCLALRKRFCRQFNFELQAAATDDAVLLSLGPQHSFPLADVFRYLHPESTRDVLVQAFLDAPVFKTRWRWNSTISLAVPRARGGRRVAPQLQRMLADDLMASVFPDAAACLENIPGDREVPDHPLVNQTVRDCLHEAMDFDGLRLVLERIHRGELRLVACDTPEPSVFAYDILNARPYAFMDDAPLEERRAHAVQTRRGSHSSDAEETGALDPSAITRVREEARPEPRDADELHDALMTTGFLTDAELSAFDPDWTARLIASSRATRLHLAGAAGREPLLVAAERLPEWQAIQSDAVADPPVQIPRSRSERAWTPATALVEIVRGRLTIEGPVTAEALSSRLGVGERDVDDSLLALESEGVVLRGRFTRPGVVSDSGPASPRNGDASGGQRSADPAARPLEWCDRALLARIHRYTLNRLRAEIEPVTPADFMRFLFTWQHVDERTKLTGLDGVREAIALLDGFELSAGAWERSVLPARLDRYDSSMLDMLCLAGEVGWARLSSPKILKLASVTPIALFLREHGEAWHALRPRDDSIGNTISDDARVVLDRLQTRGASFFNEIAAGVGFDQDRLRRAMGILVAAGLAVSDGFSGLRLLVATAQAKLFKLGRRASFAGRWTAVGHADDREGREAAVERQAGTYLKRYGIVFRRLLTREQNAAPWRQLTRIYRRLEARGEIRGGRFVSGMSGEQFALPDAVQTMREVRRTPATGSIAVISAADPLNLAGIVTAGERVRAAGRNRVACRDGVPVAVMEGEEFRPLVPLEGEERLEIARMLVRRSRVPVHVRT